MAFVALLAAAIVAVLAVRSHRTSVNAGNVLAAIDADATAAGTAVERELVVAG